MNIFKSIKNIAILILVLFSAFFILKSNQLRNKLDELDMKYNNQLALSDSLRKIEDNTYQKLAFITKEKDLEKIKNSELESKLFGKITEINKLNLSISKLSNIINDLKANTEVDTVWIDNSLYIGYRYPYKDETKEYYLDGDIHIISKTEPNRVDFKYNINFNPVKLFIITTKNSDFSYSVTVKSDSKLIQFTDINSYIPPPELPSNEPFYKKINIGLGAGIDNTGTGYILGGIKYSKNVFNVLYSGNNGNYGMQYQRFLF